MSVNIDIDEKKYDFIIGATLLIVAISFPALIAWLVYTLFWQ